MRESPRPPQLFREKVAKLPASGGKTKVGGGSAGMSLGSSAALVAAGLAVAGTGSYLSLMHGEGGSDAPRPSALVARAPLPAEPADLSAYFTSTFASFESSTRIERRNAPVRVAARDLTGRVAPTLLFADRFAGFAAPAPAPASRAAERVLRPGAAASPPVRAAGLRVDERAIAPATPPSFQLASYAPTRDDSLASLPFEFRAAIRIPPLRQAVTSLVPMANAPFPVDAGASADTG